MSENEGPTVGAFQNQTAAEKHFENWCLGLTTQERPKYTSNDHFHTRENQVGFGVLPSFSKTAGGTCFHAISFSLLFLLCY